jgi:VWFA-related protein
MVRHTKAGFEYCPSILMRGREGESMRVRTLWVPTAFLGILATAQLPAQSNATVDAQTKPPVFRSSTRAVVVDVVVTKGEDAVLALQKKDFEIFEDGKPQTIDFFEEHTAKSLPPGATAPLPKMPPNVYTNVPPAPESDSVNVLLLDSLNTPPQMESYARNEILHYLNNVKPGTRLAIVVLNAKLNFVQGFTTDAGLLREVVLKQGAPGISPSLVTKSEVGDEQELESFLSSSAPAAPGAGGGTTSSPGNGNSAGAPVEATTAVAEAFASYRSFKSANRTRMTLEAISDIARYLAAVPGRKNLIWFAGDFPVVIFPKFDQRMENEDNAITSEEVRKAADLLTAARVAVYPVYADGIMSDDIVSADNRSPSSASGPTRMASMAGMDNTTASNGDRAGLLSAMNQIASDTGGKAAYNTNDLDTAIGRSVADGSHYYALSYSPTNKKMDGKYRRIEVKVPSGKYRLAYRRGYNADDTSATVETKAEANPLHALMVRGMPNSTQILYAARVLPADPQPAPNSPHAGKNPKLTGPTTRYTVDLMIRWTDVKLNAVEGGSRNGKIQVELLAYDRDGKALNWTGATQAMSLKPDIFAAIQRSGIPAHLEIDLPTGTDVYLATGVFDLEAGKAGTMEIPLVHSSQRTVVASQVAGPAK